MGHERPAREVGSCNGCCMNISRYARAEEIAEALVYGWSKTFSDQSDKASSFAGSLRESVSGLDLEIKQMRERGFHGQDLLERRIKMMNTIEKFISEIDKASNRCGAKDG